MKEVVELIGSLKTKSDKIRTLDAAGYSRSEIAKLLDIRYQHVRKVLVDSGRALNKETKPIIKRDIISKSTLMNHGFVHEANWVLESGMLKTDKKLHLRPAVYAFCVCDEIKYIGSAVNSIAQRLYFYSKPGPRQLTSQRLNKRIIELLNEGFHVEILAAYPPDFDWNGAPVGGVIGLEYGLIKLYKPEWNIRGAK